MVIGFRVQGRTQTLTATWQEIYNAIETGSYVVIGGVDDGYAWQVPVTSLGSDGNFYVNVLLEDSETLSVRQYTASTSSDYPSYTM